MRNDSFVNSEMLKKLGVYELREMARRFGVQSPTTKKREELCELILNASSSELSTETKKQKGRPPKSVSRVNAILGEAFPDELIKLKETFSVEDDYVYKKLSLAQNTSFNYKLDEENIISGYLRFFENKYYLIQRNGLSTFITYIPDEFVEKYSLRVGDKITGIYSVAPNDENCSILVAIKTINDSTPSKRNSVDLNSVAFTNETINFMGHNLKKGSRNLISFGNISNACENIIDFIDKDKSDTKYILVGGEVAPENFYFIKSRNKIDSFLSQFGDDARDIFARVEDAFNYSTSLLLDGKKVLIIVLDPINLISNLDMVSNKESLFFKNHNANSVQMVKKIIGLGRFIDNNAYLTTITAEIANQKDDEIICEFKNSLFSQII